MCDLLRELPRRRRGRHVDELRRHRGGLQPGAVPLGRARRARSAVRGARRARPHAPDRPRVLRRRASPCRASRCSASCRATHGIPTTLSPIFHSKAVPDACDQVMAAVEREWAAGARVWPQVQTRPIDISWTLDQRSIMFLVTPGLVAGAVAADEGREARRVRRSGRRATRSSARLNMLASVPNAGLDAERLRRARGRARAQPRPRRPHARRDRRASAARRPASCSSTSPSRRTSARGSSAPTSATATPTRSAACSPIRTCTSARATAARTSARSPPTATPASSCRGTCARPARCGSKRRSRRSRSTRRRSGASPTAGSLREGYVADVVVFDADTLDRGPEVASDDFPGEGIRWIRHSVGMDTVLVDGEVTWSASEGYIDGARAGGLATR